MLLKFFEIVRGVAVQYRNKDALEPSPHLFVFLDQELTIFSVNLSLCLLVLIDIFVSFRYSFLIMIFSDLWKEDLPLNKLKNSQANPLNSPELNQADQLNFGQEKEAEYLIIQREYTQQPKYRLQSRTLLQQVTPLACTIWLQHSQSFNLELPWRTPYHIFWVSLRY